jgi:Na+-transporting NADH:ubiquinone oxidoreductase subunit NqrC
MSNTGKSLTVTMCLLSRLKERDNKDKVLDAVQNILVGSGVCTEKEILEVEQRFSEFINMVLSGINERSLTYDESYKKAQSKYPEFKINPN